MNILEFNVFSILLNKGEFEIQFIRFYAFTLFHIFFEFKAKVFLFSLFGFMIAKYKKPKRIDQPNTSVFILTFLGKKIHQFEKKG